jgi:hypothetical protein
MSARRMLASASPVFCVLLAFVLSPLFLPAQVPGGRPGETREQIEEFLRTAKITENKGISVGITGPRKLTLTDGTITHHAAFKTVNERKPGVTQLQAGMEVDFKDSWMFEIAAYEVDKLLGLNLVPPTVERVVNGQKGSAQLWIEDNFSEATRLKEKRPTPDPTAWNQQMWKVRVFDNLVYNIDRNLNNLLITPDWKLCMIDHSRTFKVLPDLKSPKDLTNFSTSLMDALKGLSKETLKQRCGKYLTGAEIDSLLKRRDKILKLYEAAAKDPSVIYP